MLKNGAIFPTYAELQLQLASPGKGKASRETVSRVLLMLRITGWLSLCKRVRDDKGRVRGNIYAQHDEPLTCYDAEEFDPKWVDSVAAACFNKNKTISQTAYAILLEIKEEPSMRHYRTHLSMIEARLGDAQTPQQMSARQQANNVTTAPSSVAEPSIYSLSSDDNPLGSETELSQNTQKENKKTIEKSVDYHRVRKPNHYVRNITRSVNNTYVATAIELPETLATQMSPEDFTMINLQLRQLPVPQAQQVLQILQRAMQQQALKNPVGWLLTILQKARNGALFGLQQPPKQIKPKTSQSMPIAATSSANKEPPAQNHSSPEKVKHIIANIRVMLKNPSAYRSDSGSVSP